MSPKWQIGLVTLRPWWRHQMETVSALLAICAGNSPVPGEFPAQRPVTRSFDVSFDLRLNKRLRKHSWGWWLRRYRAHYGVIVMAEAKRLLFRIRKRHFQTNFLFSENVRISIIFSQKFVALGPTNNTPALVQIIGRRQAIIWTNDG